MVGGSTTLILLAPLSLILAGSSNWTTVASAAERFGGDSASAGSGNGSAGDVPHIVPAADGPQAAAGDAPLLREGTRTPRVIGRFSLSGRRWSFLPEAGVSSSGLISSSGSAEMTQGQVVTTTSDQTLQYRVDDFEPAAQRPLPPMIVAENLMLQRVVEAIRESGMEDRWVIRGEISEFFGENRLTLLTAQRAAAEPSATATDRSPLIFRNE